MNRTDTLPIRLHPIPGEALDSWFAALAHRLHTPLGSLLPDLGLCHRNNDDAPADWTVLLRPAEIATVSAVTGVGQHLVEAMTLNSFDGTALLIDPATRRVRRTQLWGRNTGSRYCPDCLAETGGRWLLRWRLGWSFACTAHRRLLADDCPGCGHLPRRRILTEVLTPGRCVHPVGDDKHGRSPDRCGHDLTTMNTLRFRHDDPVLNAQRIIDEVIETRTASFGVYAAESAPAITALADLRALASRFLRYAHLNDVTTLPDDLLAACEHALAQSSGDHPPVLAGRRHGFMAPRHAAVAAVGATAAIAILNADTIRDAGHRLRRAIESARRRGHGVRVSNVDKWGQGTSTTLKAIQVSALGPFLSPSDQLRYRTGATKPHHQLPAAKASTRRRHVPTMLWTSWALRLRPAKTFQLHTLRLALSAALLLPGARHNLPDTATILGIADSRDPSRVFGALHTNPHWTHILAALTHLADYLDAHAIPIDYDRRRGLDYTALLPEDQWHHICLQSRFPPGHGRRLDLARCLLFEKISMVPADLAPGSFAIDSSYRRDCLLEFAAPITPDLALRLNEAAQEFLAQQGIHDEPVEWQPPLALLDGLSLPGADPDHVDINTLHRLIREDDTALTIAAQRLGSSLDVVRHLLEQHPAPPRPITKSQARATGLIRVALREALPRDRLNDLYHDQQLTLREIGSRFGVTKNVIGRLLDDYGIERRERPRPGSGIVIDRDWLYDQPIHQPAPHLERPRPGERNEPREHAALGRKTRHSAPPTRRRKPQRGPPHARSGDHRAESTSTGADRDRSVDPAAPVRRHGRPSHANHRCLRTRYRPLHTAQTDQPPRARPRRTTPYTRRTESAPAGDTYRAKDHHSAPEMRPRGNVVVVSPISGDKAFRQNESPGHRDQYVTRRHRQEATMPW